MAQRRGLDWVRAQQELLEQAAQARGVKPVSDLPGAGFGGFAEDDPEAHAAHETPDLERTEPITRPESE